MINRCRFLIFYFVFIIGTINPMKCLAAFEIVYSERTWRKLLIPAQFEILRKWKTERPFFNSLYGKKSDLLLYESKTKYDSGTGWPSFWAPITVNVNFCNDWYFVKLLTEAHRNRCGGHLGHVFDDGPKPTGKCHCINGLALIFRES